MTKLSTSGFFGSVQEIAGQEEDKDEDGVTTLGGMFSNSQELPLLPTAQCRARPMGPQEAAVVMVPHSQIVCGGSQGTERNG